MSGITGIWHLDGAPVERSEIDCFNNALIQRGRDRSGIYIDDSQALALGHRRYLFPNSTHNDDQPLSYGAGRYWITVDGEIYNLTCLREQLRQYGHSFKNQSTAEVVLAAFLQWGLDCQFEFNGKWAFAIWDSSERRLFLARDRFGQKPLYTCHIGDYFAFASELKAFLSLPWFDLSFNPEYITTAILNTDFVHTLPVTFLKSVMQLKSGCCLTINQNKQFNNSRWWRTIEHMEMSPPEFEEQVECFQELFSDASRLRNPEQGSLGIALSGGMDSTTIMAALSQIINKDGSRGPSDSSLMKAVDAYVGYYDVPAWDEREPANSLIRQTGVNAHYKPFLYPSSSSELDEILFIQEGIVLIPEIDTIVKAMKRDGIQYAMTGDGADTIFGTTLATINIATAEALLGKHKLQRLAEMVGLRQVMLTEMGETQLAHRLRVLMYSLMPVVKYLLRGKNGFQPGKPKYFDGEGYFNHPVLSAEFLDFQEDEQQLDHNHLLALNRYFSLQNGFNNLVQRYYDLIFMNNGIKWRTPFMDWRLVCFALSLPSDSIIRRGYTKPVMREAMRDHLPDVIRTKKSKVAFVDTGVGRFRKMKNIILETIREPFFLESELIRGPALAARIEKAYKDNNFENATMLFRAVCAVRLQHLFVEKHREYLAGQKN